MFVDNHSLFVENQFKQIENAKNNSYIYIPAGTILYYPSRWLEYTPFPSYSPASGKYGVELITNKQELAENDALNQKASIIIVYRLESPIVVIKSDPLTHDNVSYLTSSSHLFLTPEHLSNLHL